MDEPQIDISGFAYDLNAIVDFVFQNQNKEKNSEIREIYEKNADNGNLELIQKSLTEVKNEDLTSISTIRYDLIKTLMDKVNEIPSYNDFDYDVDLDLNEENKNNEDVNSPFITNIGETFALNTLLNEGMLIPVNIEDIIKNG